MTRTSPPLMCKVSGDIFFLLLSFIHSCSTCILLVLSVAMLVIVIVLEMEKKKTQQRYDKRVLGILLLIWRRLAKSSSHFSFKTDGLPTVSCDLIGTLLGVSGEKLLLSNSILQQYTTCLQTPSAGDSASLAALSERCIKTAFHTRLL